MQARCVLRLSPRSRRPSKRASWPQQRFTDSLIETDAPKFLRALYSASRRYPDSRQYRSYARYRLADQALADYDIRLPAARLHAGAGESAGRRGPDIWALRRAVCSSMPAISAAQCSCSTLFSQARSNSTTHSPSVLSGICFDLQAAGQHTQVIALLEKNLSLNKNPAHQPRMSFTGWQTPRRRWANTSRPRSCICALLTISTPRAATCGGRRRATMLRGTG